MCLFCMVSGMHEKHSGSGLAKLLMYGPRGRRLLLEYAIASERLHYNESHDDSFSTGVFWASYHLDPGKGTSVSVFGYGDVETVDVTAAQIADRMATIALAEVTPALLRDALFISVGSDGTGKSPMAAMRSQRPTRCGRPCGGLLIMLPPRDTPHGGLNRSRNASNGRLAGKPRPPGELPSSAGELFDGSPAKLWFVEDSYGWERATAQRLAVPETLQIYEIDSAQAWAGLCARFQLEVTAQKRHDWYRTTGRHGRWVMQDWAEVAKHYDAVHLQTRAYLSAAGTAICVDEHTASVIAGWDPDVTYWFTPHVRYHEEAVTWVLEVHDAHAQWFRVAKKNDGSTLRSVRGGKTTARRGRIRPL